MTRRRKVVLALILVAMAGAIYLFGPTNWIDNHLPWKRRQMMAITLEWGRLAAFPVSARDVHILTEGGMFTRGFRASFVAQEADIEDWIRRSPGLRDVAPERRGRIRKYSIAPGDGASFAGVVVDDDAHLVQIHVYSS
jgi:hypothetical protein